MRELERVRRALADARRCGLGVVLVTVTRVEGSVYRGVGARMVVNADGGVVGAVSGGCLEADVVARAEGVLARDVPELVHYDTRASDDVVLGLGLGCQGVIDLFLEPLRGERLAEAERLYATLCRCRDPVTLLTRTRATPHGSAPGTRALLDETGMLIEGDLQLAECGPDDESVARELVHPAVPLVICGAGGDAIPVARLGSAVGYHVTVLDHRAAFLTAERFPDADALVQVDASAESALLASDVVIDARTAAVVMAHSAVHDRAWLHTMLDGGAGYVGVLGPRRRTLELLGERAPDGVLPAVVHAPVGLDVGAETPEEIALSIIAEVAAATTGRAGGRLRDRDGPIHPERGRAAAPAAAAHDIGS